MSKQSKNPFLIYDEAKADEMVTEQLTKEGLYIEESTEVIGKKKDYAVSVKAPKEYFQFPHDSIFLDDPERRASYLFRAATDSEFSGIVNRDRKIEMSSPLGRIMGPPPASLRESVLREFLERGFFHVDNTDDPKIESAAFLMERKLNTKELVAQFAPAIDFTEFHRYQSIINRTIDRKFPLYHQVFEEYWNDKKLKPPIKHALKVAFLENDANENLSEISKRIRIPYETLRSRIEAGKKILKNHFWHLTPVDELPKTPKPKHRERQFNGFYLRSAAVKVHPVYKIDPKTNAKTIDFSRTSIRYRDLQKTPQKGIEAKEEWENLTTYEPKHNGVSSPLLAYIQNAYPSSMKAGLVNSGRVYIKFVSADEKSAFEKLKKPFKKRS